MSRRSFTLIELLIVMGILSVLAAAVTIVLNPAELLAQSRDGTRLSDIGTISKAVSLAQVYGASLGTPNTIYISIPDNASSTCGDLGLPAAPAGWTYSCVSGSNLKKTNGSGWIPVNFSLAPTGSPLPLLPIDPVDSTSTAISAPCSGGTIASTAPVGLYYVYVTDGITYQVGAISESQKYRPQPSLFSTGSNSGLVSYIATFNSSGTFTCTANLTAQVLVVAGGGGGGGGQGCGGGCYDGGGGGGGVVYSSAYPLTATSVPVTIGLGGGSSSGHQGSPGGNSSFGSITALGGGGGGSNGGGAGGGSGGGGGGSGGGGGGATQPGSPSGGFGNAGAAGGDSTDGGGGGGAGAPGQSGAGGSGGAGGNGYLTTITGTSSYFGGGGGGNTAAIGGLGGGGGDGGNGGGTPGTPNTGGGGGGIEASNPGGAGGSGVVIINFP